MKQLLLIFAIFLPIMACAQPPGTIVAFAGTKESVRKLESQGWILCDGKLYDRTAVKFQKLFAAIGTSWGGDGGNRFAVPDLRGQFLRGVSMDSRTDPDAEMRDKARPDLNSSGNGGNAVGSRQRDGVGPHAHKYLDHMQPAQNTFGDGDERGLGDHERETRPYGENIGKETRPINVYVYYLIKL